MMLNIIKKTPFGAIPNFGNVKLVGTSPTLERLLTSYLKLGLGSKRLEVYYLSAVQIVYCMGMYSPLAEVKQYDSTLKIKSAFLKSGHSLFFAQGSRQSQIPPTTLYQQIGDRTPTIDLSYFQDVIDFFYIGDEGSFALDSLLLSGVSTAMDERSFPELFSLVSMNFSRGSEQQALFLLIHLLNLASVRVACLEQFFDFSSIATFKKAMFTASYEQARSYALPLSNVVTTEVMALKSTENDYFKYEALFQLFFAPLSIVQLQKEIEKAENTDAFKNATRKIEAVAQSNPIVEQLKILNADLPLAKLISRVLVIQQMCLAKLEGNPILKTIVPQNATLDMIFVKLPNLQGILDSNNELKGVFSTISEKVLEIYDDKAWVKDLLKPTDAKNVVGKEDVVYNDANCSLKDVRTLTTAQFGAKILVPSGASYLNLLTKVFRQYTEAPLTPALWDASIDIAPNAAYLYSILSFYTLQCYVSTTCGLVGSSEEVVGIDQSIGDVDVLMGEKNKETLLDLFVGVGLGVAMFGIFVMGTKIYKQNKKASNRKK